jgi:phospholipase D1/2
MGVDAISVRPEAPFAPPPHGTFALLPRFSTRYAHVTSLDPTHVPILVPQRNVWRIERAGRVAVLADGAECFQAIREAFLQARQSIFIVGWDIHSRTRLVGETGQAEDNYPAELGELLRSLAKERPRLKVHLLLWDYSVLYALEREPLPIAQFQWNTPPGVRFALDNCVPFGASQHQKIVLVDDAVAFSGGLDLTIRRWDTPAHRPDDPHRIDPAGRPYRPFHDVQIMVDGAAARALAELVRARWRAATSEEVALGEPADIWANSVNPDFTNIDVGIARTRPDATETTEPVREVEQLFLDAIDAAERTIYIENQFLTSLKVAEHLARRMQQNPSLETLIVAPHHHDSWLAEGTMRNGRIRFKQVFMDAGVGDRVRLAHPHVAGADSSTSTMLHSKVMVIDDRLLRVGSANLNNRSMGTDTECDIAVAASNAKEKSAILAVRSRLLADHCGVQPADVANASSTGQSLIELSRKLTGNGHSLRDIDDGNPDQDAALSIEGLADPESPIEARAFITSVLGNGAPHLPMRTLLKVAAALLGIVALTLIWHLTPLSSQLDPETLETSLASLAGSPWSPIIVVAVFVGGGLVAFPVNLLIAATAAAFGPFLGFAYAAMGILASALVTYGAGAWIGRKALMNLVGPRLSRIRNSLARRGVLAVATVRMVPLAPFTLVNVVAGASQIRLTDYLAGTALGMAPGLIALSALGHQILHVLSNPTPGQLGLLALAVTLWIAMAIGVQAFVQWMRRSV